MSTDTKTPAATKAAVKSSLTIVAAIALGLFFASQTTGSVDSLYEWFPVFAVGLCLGTITVTAVELFSRKH